MSLNTIINICTGVACVICAVIILISLFKILTGDEQDARIYTKRIKNALLALACILLITTIKGVVVKYFPEGYMGIGTMPKSQTGQK